MLNHHSHILTKQTETAYLPAASVREIIRPLKQIGHGLWSIPVAGQFNSKGYRDTGTLQEGIQTPAKRPVLAHLE
jgi:hypothetical protein